MKQEELIRKLSEFKNSDRINYFTHKNNINDEIVDKVDNLSKK